MSSSDSAQNSGGPLPPRIGKEADRNAAVYPPDPTPYLTRILQLPVTREDLVLLDFQNDLRLGSKYPKAPKPYPRVGVMDWKSESESLNQKPAGSPSYLRQFNLSLWSKHRGEDPYDIFTRSRLKSASQIAATESELRKNLLNMEGIHSRVVVLEQMAEQVVETVGSVYNIDPQFWAQHTLLRDNESWTWETCQQPKPFFSVRLCHTASFKAGNPPWDSESGPVNIPHEIVSWFQSNHDLVLDCDHLKGRPRRRLRPLFHSQKPFVSDSDPVLAALELCVSVYFHQSDDAVPKITTIILVDPCPLIWCKTNFEKRLVTARPLAPDCISQQDTEDRWSLDDIWDLLRQQDGSAPRTIVGSIMNLFQRDLIALASRSHLLMDEMKAEMRNPAKVEENLRSKSWENLLANLAETEPIMRRTIDTFSMVLSTLESPPSSPLQFHRGPSIGWVDKTELSSHPSVQVERLFYVLNQLSERVDKTQSAFESRIALAERQHQLHESKTMKRLTELAFVFIPLSLSTSIFGMEMQEFNGGIPLYYWVITSVSLLVAAYAVRWSVTSRGWRSVKGKWIRAVVQLYPHYHGDENNIHKSAYITAIFLPLYKPCLVFADFIDNVLRYPAGVPFLNVPAIIIIVTLYLALPLITFPIVWTRKLLALDAKIAWTIFGVCAALQMWIWVPLGLAFWDSDRGHKGALGVVLLHILPALSLLFTPVLFTVAWSLANLSLQARAGYTAAGATMLVGALGILTLRNAVRFRERLGYSSWEPASDHRSSLLLNVLTLTGRLGVTGSEHPS